MDTIHLISCFVLSLTLTCVSMIIKRNKNNRYYNEFKYCLLFLSPGFAFLAIAIAVFLDDILIGFFVLLALALSLCAAGITMLFECYHIHGNILVIKRFFSKTKRINIMEIISAQINDSAFGDEGPNFQLEITISNGTNVAVEGINMYHVENSPGLIRALLEINPNIKASSAMSKRKFIYVGATFLWILLLINIAVAISFLTVYELFVELNV